MESDALTLYKLIILFLLDKVDFPLTNAQISNFILEKDYTNYFSIQQSLSELIEAEFVTIETIRNSSYYRITESGRETLSFFDSMISSAIQEDIIKYLKENKFSLRDEVSTLSEYFETKKGEYTVRLRVIEKGDSIIDLSLSVPTEVDAIKICANWRINSQNVYASVLTNLLKE
jgi:DNA-binding PadR family transcriptional regulator